MEDLPQNCSAQAPLLPYHNSNPHRSSRFKISEVVKEVRQLYNIAFPLILSGLLTYGKSAISMTFMGHLGKEALAGGSLAVGFANITGYSVLSGLAMGMDAISSQACGAKQWSLMGQTLQRTILILLLFCIPISFLWLNIHPILIFLGQDPTICSVAATYLTYCLPDLFFIALINPLKSYLRSQNVTGPLVLSAGVALSFHFPVNYIMVNYLNYGIKGVAIATSIMDLNVLLVTVVYLIITGTHKKTWQGWSRDCLRDWSIIISLAIPNCISVCLEWWWYELMIVMSGLLPNAADAVATMGLLIQATSLIYIFPSSLSLAVSTRVGNELGAGRPNKARTCSNVSLCCAIFTSVLALAFSVTMRNVWGRAFTSDEAIIALTAAAMPILGLCELGNCPQTTMCGVLRGSARPKLGANINLGAFYGVGLPIAIGMGFFIKMGLLGLWLGLLGAQVACSLFMAIMLVRTDWDAETQRAKELTGGTNSDIESEQHQDSKIRSDSNVCFLYSKYCNLISIHFYLELDTEYSLF
ncbi:protein DETOXIFICATION 49-like [Amaranthus tricolor]|uniref:protein DETOXIFICATION 49-like n=1 Tax=Amaranthus tricolor TaxID=29722 RepID=UPI0025867CC3|nr:protein DETOXIFICATION 49-like [Amaranthus tricolor]